jgi:hypothetical protein
MKNVHEQDVSRDVPRQVLEDWNPFSWNVVQVIVQSKQRHEGEEHTCSRAEVPDVVVVVKVEQN